MQKEWGYALNRDKKHILATTKILYCTGFYGYDINHVIGFLCHFDFPWSTGSLPYVFDALEKHVHRERQINCYIVGGWSFRFWWSRHTRRKIRKYISHLNNCGWNINLNEKLYNNQCLSLCKDGWSMALQLDVRNGHVRPYSKSPMIRKKGTSVFKFLARYVDE